jgi:hypothetical protein
MGIRNEEVFEGDATDSRWHLPQRAADRARRDVNLPVSAAPDQRSPSQRRRGIIRPVN